MNPPEQPDGRELSRQYELRFAGKEDYRRAVWSRLTGFFEERYSIDQGSSVLDLGCGYGEFINGVAAGDRHAMDLNPDSSRQLDPGITFHEQDCSQPWPVTDLDFVFTSNFFEHLPDKDLLMRTLNAAWGALKPGGTLICLGPNIRRVPGGYWDFWDHYLPLTERSLEEAMKLAGFDVFECIGSFLPYSMSQGRRPPAWTVALYLRAPLLWRVLGKQFLVAGRKPQPSEAG